MALIRTGGLISDIRGSIGGTVFARNRGGAYARNRTAPLNPQTSAQVRARSALATFAQRWATVLTQAQRDAWDLYAENVPLPNSLGESRNVSGIAMYNRANTLLQQCGMTTVDDAPTIFTVGPTIQPTITLAAAADTATVTDLGDWDFEEDPVGVFIAQGRPQNPGVQFYKSPFTRILGLEATGQSLPAGFADIPLAYPIEAGQAVFLRVSNVLPDGRVGVPVIQRFLVA
jgi:hypothetical protein